MPIDAPVLESPIVQSGTTSGFLRTGISYTYSVRAFNTTEQSSISNSVAFIPTGVTDTNKVTITWHDLTLGPGFPVTGATGYYIYRIGPSTITVLAKVISSGGTISYEDTGADFPESPVDIEVFFSGIYELGFTQRAMSFDYQALPFYELARPQVTLKNIEIIGPKPQIDNGFNPGYN